MALKTRKPSEYGRPMAGGTRATREGRERRTGGEGLGRARNVMSGNREINSEVSIQQRKEPTYKVVRSNANGMSHPIACSLVCVTFVIISASNKSRRRWTPKKKGEKETDGCQQRTGPSRDHEINLSSLI